MTIKTHNWRTKDILLIDLEIIDKLREERCLSYKTYQGYCNAVSCFEKCFNTSLANKLEIYYHEEEEIVWKKRTLKKDLIKFRNYLAEHYLKSTLKIYLTRFKTLLNHLELEIHYIPPMNSKQLKDLEPITHEDLLTPTIIRDSLNCVDKLGKAIILFMVSSGSARRETLNLTVNDYLTANNVTNIKDIDVSNIPCFKIHRQKTDKYYFTYCTPQANHAIYDYLRSRGNLKPTAPLFDTNLYYFNKMMSDVNASLDLGNVRKYHRFRSHMLRKYNASTLYNNGMSMTDVDALQGRGKDSTHSSYFMEDPKLLKQKYSKYVEVLTI